ncbi:hypothetical protein TNCV_995701 [Trichonephila clavipes]|nr:hypothetical protein TNCV_995701 [Trichonephila clavipes]
MQTRGDRDVYPIATIPSLQVMGQYNDDECTLLMRVYHDTTKHGCDHLNAANRTCIHLKKRRLAICMPRFVVDHNIENFLVCDAASWVAAAMVSELRVHAAANVVELFV